MIRFSDRVPLRLEPNRLSEARARIGEIAYDLTISNPTLCDLPYPEDLLVPLADPAGFEYRPEPRGPLPARRAIAASFDRFGVNVDPDAVVVAASTSEAYSLLFKLLCNPSDAIIAPTPSYPLFDPLSRLDGVKIHPFNLGADDDWRFDLGRIEAAPASTRAIILVHPNNPTGSHVHPDDAAAVRSLCRERGLALIVDEVFLPFTLDGGPGSGETFAATDECLTFTLGGLSKSIGLPQLKLAWIVVGGPDELVASALDRLDYITDAYLSVSTPVALAAPGIMTAAQSVQTAIASRCRANLNSLRDEVESQPAVTVPAVGGGWSVAIRLPAVLDDEETALRLLTQLGVAVQPGYFFDLPSEGTLVLSLLTPESTWRKGLEILFEAVGSWLD